MKLLHVQGEQPHCGFPEKNFSDNAEKLARKVEYYKQCLVKMTTDNLLAVNNF